MDKGLGHSDYCVFFFRASGFWVGPGCWGLRRSVCSWGCLPSGQGPAVCCPSGSPFSGRGGGSRLGPPSAMLPWVSLYPLSTVGTQVSGCPPGMTQCGCGPPTTSRVKLSYTHTLTTRLCFANHEIDSVVCVFAIVAPSLSISDVIVTALSVVLQIGKPASHLLSLKGLTQSQPDF